MPGYCSAEIRSAICRRSAPSISTPRDSIVGRQRDIGEAPDVAARDSSLTLPIDLFGIYTSDPRGVYQHRKPHSQPSHDARLAADFHHIADIEQIGQKMIVTPITTSCTIPCDPNATASPMIDALAT